MSFINNAPAKPSYSPGWFLADDENAVRLTFMLEDDGDYVTTADDGAKYVAMGTFIGSPIYGIVYEDVDLSTGDMPASIVVAGHYYEDRVIGTVSGNDALISAGEAPAVTRP